MTLRRRVEAAHARAAQAPHQRSVVLNVKSHLAARFCAAMRAPELGWQLQTRAAVPFELELLRLQILVVPNFPMRPTLESKVDLLLEATKEHLQLDTHGCLGQPLVLMAWQNSLRNIDRCIPVPVTNQAQATRHRGCGIRSAHHIYMHVSTNIYTCVSYLMQSI